MEPVGGGLAAKIILPNDVVQLQTIRYVEPTMLAVRWYQLNLKWNTVTCP